jgi:hypothetical protein
MHPPTDSEREDARIERAERRAEHEAAFREPERARCAACGARTDIHHLDASGVCDLCRPYVEAIAEMCR